MESKILIVLILVLILIYIFKFKNNFGNIVASTPVPVDLPLLENAIKSATESVDAQQKLVDALEKQIRNISNLNIHAPELLSQTRAVLISAQDQLLSAQDQLTYLTKNKV